MASITCVECRTKEFRPDGLASLSKEPDCIGCFNPVESFGDSHPAIPTKTTVIAYQGGKLCRQQDLANAYNNIGRICRTRGELERAKDMYKKALAINEKLGRQEGVAMQYGNLGHIAKDRGDLTQARKLWNQARDLFVKHAMRHSVEMVQAWLDGLPPG